ncbi:hypothetical protein [Mycobacteroides immunogenum]|uniref:hypothetical protein n=1 Tax=Mycobacteroides immunogenum TaxID=83262 RepID=UPI00103A7023|nr:hypothetical protein [Mycobacteroides immunogenum]
MSEQVLLEVDSRRRLNLNKVGHHDLYTASVHEDGTIILTPALVISPAELHFLHDAEVQRIVQVGRRNTDKTRHLNRTRD